MTNNLIRQKLTLQAKLNKARPFYEKALFHSLSRFYSEELLTLTSLVKSKKTYEECLSYVNSRQERLKTILKSHYIILSKDFNPKLMQSPIHIEYLDLVIDKQVSRIYKTSLDYFTQAFKSKDIILSLTKVYKFAGRFMKIAKTESNTIVNYCLFAKALDEQKTKKYWVCVKEPNVREDHAALDLMSLPITETWNNGCLFPGDPNSTAGNIINCRCFQIYE